MCQESTWSLQALEIWVLNDETLYALWQREYNGKALRAFVREKRVFLEAYVYDMLERCDF